MQSSGDFICIDKYNREIYHGNKVESKPKGVASLKRGDASHLDSDGYLVYYGHESGNAYRADPATVTKILK